MTIRAVLFDIGGPIDMETRHEELIDRDLRAALEAEGFPVTDEAFRRWNDDCIRRFAPNLYHAIAWELTGRDRPVCERVSGLLSESSLARLHERGGYELRPGIPQLLERLCGAGLLLGLAANQPAYALDELERCGVLRFFKQRGVSQTIGYRKPDVRLFLAACESLGVDPFECLMVGDRIDNDICPPKTVGMATILFRTGRHRDQQPRTWHEVPDVEVWNVEGLEDALFRLIEREGGLRP